MNAETEEEYRAIYEAGLEKIGREVILARLEGLRERAEGRTVVLMCFCDLAAGAYCHRRMLSRWLLKKTRNGLAEISQPIGGKR